MMNGLRRFISVFVIALLLVGLVFGYMWFRTKSFSQTEPVKAIPENPVLFMETDDFPQLAANLKNHNDIWQEFRSYEIIEQLNRQILEFDSLARSFPEFGIMLETPALISLNRINRKYHLLFVVSPGKFKATEEILKLLSNEAGIDKRKYQNQTIYKLKFKKQRIWENISFYETAGLLVMSSSPEMLEASVRSLNNDGNIQDGENFERLRATTGKDAVANLYINYSGLSLFLNNLFTGVNTGKLAQFAQWSALDLDIKPDFLSLNGFTTTSDTLPQQLSLLKNQEAVEFSLTSVIPSGAVYFKFAGYSNPEALFSRIEATNTSGKIKESLPESFREDFISLLSNESGEAIVRTGNNYEKYFIMSLKSGQMAESLMSERVKTVSEKNGSSLAANSKKVLGDNRNPFTIYHSSNGNLPSEIFSGLFPSADYSYFTILENYLVFGSSYDALKDFLYQNVLGKTLENDEYFNRHKNNFASSSNLFVYLNPSLYFNEILRLLNKKAEEQVSSSAGKWKKINAVSFQSTSAGDMNYFHMFLNYSGEIRESVNTVWERKLDTTSSFKPAIVLNHNNNEKEIFLQDQAGNIYLIDNSGNILWKQKIEGEILGDVFQIDYYKNGKLQYLFNTPEKIYLLDRNGNPVERFPLNLRDQATAGLSLFDYDRDGTLRICIPTRNKDIYMYDSEGRLISGWRFKKADYPVMHPVQHIQTNEKDYIIAHDKMMLHILDRKGNDRVNPASQIMFSARNPVYIMNNRHSSPHITASDTSGSVYNFFFDGSVNKLFSLSLSADHFFVPSDLNGDGKTEYVFIDGKKLMVSSAEGNVIFDEEFPEPIDKKPVIYEFSSTDKKIGVVAAQSGRNLSF